MTEILTLQGSQAAPFLPDLAKLRIRVFREYPYLYEGTLAYEEQYLANYFASQDSLLVIARDTRDGRIVGASTAMPMIEAEQLFQSSFQSIDYNTSNIFYFGESVLLPEYRGQGIGHKFFDERETAAKRAGLPITAFCAVVRPDNHPQRPADYRPLNSFWTKRGYIHHPEIQVSLDWKEPGNPYETPHKLSFWIRDERD